jgi:hypothetical protein
MGCWVGPRIGLDYLEKRKFLALPGLELRPVANRYTDSHINVKIHSLENEKLYYGVATVS